MGMSFDSHFLWLIVHDLRNPLNVIRLTLRLLQDSLPAGDPALQADLEALGENVGQMERMLSRLSDYSRLFDPTARAEAVPFDPRRMAEAVVEDHATRAPQGAPAVQVEAAADCPPVVHLDLRQAHAALLCAVTNAVASAEGGPVRVSLGGGPDRLVVRVRVDHPPQETVRPAVLRSDTFDKLIGNEKERLSLELALAARVTELFGGTARLDVEPGRGTSIVLDWPAKLAAA
jgi:two-component system, NarL family, capsular synthesis sensor histidine kinase RcsC